jgi:hypothetical protein
MSFLFSAMAYTFFMQQADSFLLSFFLSAYSPCSLVQVQLSTKEINTTTDVSCKSNALKHEDEADHTRI